MTPEKIGRYQIQSALGRGGMATVYAAYDPSFERQVAIKLLPREFLHDPQFHSRFQREAKAIAALEHPAILPVYDFGEEDGQPYLVMRLMTGGSLKDRIEQGSLELDEALVVVERVGAALGAAHSKGVIHRDLKPGNILFDGDGNPAIADFGIVKLTEHTSQLTGSGMVGTPAYMAPEMAAAGGVTPLIDIYAMGVTLYQMLAGRLPYNADTPMGLMAAHITEPVPDIHTARPDLPADAQYIIERAMAKDPAQRYQSMGEMMDDLRALVMGGGGAATLAAPISRSRTTRAPLPSMATQRAPQPAPAATRRGVSLGLLAGVAVALIAVVALGLGMLGALPLGIGGPQVAEVSPTPPPTEMTTATVEAVEPAIISIQPTVRLLFGEAELKAAGSSYAALTADSPVSAGASIRTGPRGAALLILAEGVSVEAHPGSLLTIQRLEVVGDTLFVELAQEAGTTYHFVGGPADGLKRDYAVFSPRGITKAVGTQFWISEAEEGWYYIPTDGVIIHDLHNLNNDPADQYQEYAAKQDCLLVDVNFNVSNCKAPSGLALLTDGSGLAATLTPTVAVVEGEQPTETVEGPTLTPTALAAVEQCGPGWLPTGGCKCCGTTLVCADGTVAEFNPRCGIGGSGPPTPAPGCGSCGDGGSTYIIYQETEYCNWLDEWWLEKRDACGVVCYDAFDHCQ